MTNATVRCVRSVKDWHMWLAIGLWLAFSLWFFAAGPYAVMADQGGIPDSEFWHAADEVADRLAAMDGGVRHDYRVFLATDFVFIALYGTATAMILAQAFQVLVRRKAFWHLVWVPVVGATADALENVAMFFALDGASAWPFVMFQSIKAVFTTAGMVLAAVAALALLGHGVMHPVKRR